MKRRNLEFGEQSLYSLGVTVDPIYSSPAPLLRTDGQKISLRNDDFNVYKYDEEKTLGFQANDFDDENQVFTPTVGTCFYEYQVFGIDSKGRLHPHGTLLDLDILVWNTLLFLTHISSWKFSVYMLIISPTVILVKGPLSRDMNTRISMRCPITFFRLRQDWK